MSAIVFIKTLTYEAEVMGHVNKLLVTGKKTIFSWLFSFGNYRVWYVLLKKIIAPEQTNVIRFRFHEMPD